MGVKQYLLPFLLGIVIILLLIKHCGKVEQVPAPMPTNEIRALEKQIGMLLIDNEELKQRAIKAEQNSNKRDTVYVTRIKRIREIAPAECDTFISMVVQECDTLIITKEVEIAVKDSIMVVDSTIINKQQQLIKKQRRHKRIAVLGAVVIFILSVIN